jgi:hypothetical protein
LLTRINWKVRKQINGKSNNIDIADDMKKNITAEISFQTDKKTRSLNPGTPSS